MNDIKKKVVLIVQARTGSTRLKSKILKEVFGRPILSLLIERLKFCKKVDQIVIATTINKADDIIVEVAKQNGVAFFRGSEGDLLDRHYKAGIQFNADIIIKVPSDCPLADPSIIDKAIQYYLDNETKFDYVSNYHPPTFPDGLDVEVIPIEILKNAWMNAEKDYEREHLTPYIWEQPEKFRIGNITNNENLFIKERWTLDYQEDYTFIKTVFEHLYKEGTVFHMSDALDLLQKYPEIRKINHKYAGVNWYRNEGNKLKTVPRYSYKKDNTNLKFDNSIKLLNKSKKIIPCATQTLSKGYTQWSVGACPLFIESAKGCEVTDVDGNVYIDYAMGLGPFILGYSDPDVNKAVSEQLEKGTMFTLPHPLEIKAAELIIENVPCAEMVRFGKNGSDVTSAAVKVARAYTNKEKIIICGYHGWQDWYIVSTERNKGIPKCMGDLVIPLEYNNIEMLENIIIEHKEKIAGLIMEPVCAVPPENNFLEEVRRITTENNIVLIFDEMFTGFRWSIGGAQEYFNVIPDLACFGKAIANGFPVSCIAGKKEIMSAFEEVFFSFTYGGETLSLAAIVATINKLKTYKVHEHVEKLGNYLIEETSKLINKHGIESYISIIGYPFKSVINFNGNKYINPFELKTLFQQECAKRGILFIGYHEVSYSHTKEHIDFTLEAYDEIMGILKDAINNNNVKSLLKGAIVTQIFKNVGDRSMR